MFSGSQFTLEYQGDETSVVVTIAQPRQPSRPDESIIALETPLAMALMRAKVGEVINLNGGTVIRVLACKSPE